MAIGNLKEVITHVETLRAAMNEIASQLPEYPVVMAMKGVGPYQGPQLLAEIGDPMRFKHREALSRLCGRGSGYQSIRNPESREQLCFQDRQPAA